MRVSQNQGYHFWCPYNKDDNILVLILGSNLFKEITISRFGKWSLRFKVRDLGSRSCC